MASLRDQIVETATTLKVHVVPALERLEESQAHHVELFHPPWPVRLKRAGMVLGFALALLGAVGGCLALAGVEVRLLPAMESPAYASPRAGVPVDAGK